MVVLYFDWEYIWRGGVREKYYIMMVLVDLTENEIRKYTSKAADVTFDMEMDYGIRFSPVIENEAHFTKWVDSLPYYKNVSEEGV